LREDLAQLLDRDNRGRGGAYRRSTNRIMLRSGTSWPANQVVGAKLHRASERLDFVRAKGRGVTMNRSKTVLLAVVAVFAFSAMAAASASAAHVWLIGGAEVKEGEEVNVLIDGTIFLHHQLPAIVGGGEITLKCTGQFHGTVNFKGLDKITSVLGLKGETSKLDCEVSQTSSTLCKLSELLLVSALHLPWHSQLLLVTIGGKEVVVDDLLSEAGKVPGYESECIVSKIKISCEGADRSQFIKNTAGGSVFEFFGELKNGCSDGGTGTLLGSGELLGVQVS
jgi:hypothetical protein